MPPIIDLAIDAHGGLKRWSRVEKVSACFCPSGLALTLRGQDAFSHRSTRVTVDASDQRVSFDPFLEPGHVGRYTPDRTVVARADGSIVEELVNPRASFAAIVGDTLGHEVHYEQITGEQWVENLYGTDIPFLSQHLNAAVPEHRVGGFAGTNDVVERIGGRRPMTVAEFVEKHRDAFR